jgi:hypothetical protein
VGEKGEERGRGLAAGCWRLAAVETVPNCGRFGSGAGALSNCGATWRLRRRRGLPRSGLAEAARGANKLAAESARRA